ncbi:MAG: glutathione synthase [Gammaproteobacteria bacterium]|nr:glutathione synthase [Gammaproteobacteria bacterium]
MALSILVVMDDIRAITPYKDTTLAMLRAAKSRGHQTYCCDTVDLSVINGQAMAQARHVEAKDSNDVWFEFKSDVTPMSLGDFDAILMRKDPPFDMNFVYATYALDLAEAAGSLVVNRPAALRNTNEKYTLAAFADIAPPTLISADRDQLRAFHAEHGDIIIKPLDGMGGEGIYRLKQDDPNITMLLDASTHRGSTPIMAQTYLPEIKQGDKRILVVNGKAMDHGLARIPKSGETRGNIAAGGTGVVMPLTDRDRWLVAQAAPRLVERGLWFVGLDVIGDYVTEINVTSPTCAVEIAKETGQDATQALMDFIESARAA